MKLIDQVYEITVQLEKVLDDPNVSKDRDAQIEKVHLLIEKREEIMKELVPPFSVQEEETGQMVLVLNKQIEKKMQLLFNEIKADMRRINKQKESNRSYINPYRNMNSTDGIYHDSKQ